MKKLFVFIVSLIVFNHLHAQVITITGVGVTGRFNSCSGSNTPTVTAQLISTSGGASVSGGLFTCLNPCDSSTIRVNISNIRWNKSPNNEWLHGLFLPANLGFSVSPVFIPSGFIAYNVGCVGQCPSGSGTNGGPGFYFDATNQNTASCCSPVLANDGVPCNNFGDVTIGCGASLSLIFDITFCNSIITASSYQFVFTGSSDGETGCYNFNSSLAHYITFTIPTVPCAPQIINPSGSTPIRTCIAGVPNYTSTLTGTCNANNINWWTAAVGGTLIGTGSPFTYDPAGSACPAGTTLYATCCNGGNTTCVPRTPFTIPGTCDPLLMSSVTTTNSTCSAFGSIDIVNVLNAQGAINYVLNPGGISNTTGVFTGLNQTNYTVTATDAGGCSVTTAIVISQPPVITFSAPAITNVTCTLPASGQISISASGGTGALSYSINPGATQISPGVFTGLTAQTYTISATDITTCSNSTIVTLVSPPIPNWATTSSSNITCNGLNNGSINVLANGGTGVINYTLLPLGTINSIGLFNSLGAGIYTVQATDANGCSITTSFTIVNPPLLTWASVSSIGTTCSYLNNGSLNALAAGGTTSIQYQLLPSGAINGTGNFTSLSSGSYTVIASDANNCSVSTTINILQAPPINILPAIITNPLCNNGNNGTISINASGGTGALTYTLTAPTTTNSLGVFNGLTAGNYTITVSDINACSSTINATILQPSPIIFSVANATNLLCYNGSNGTLSVTATGGVGTFNYILQPGGISSTTGNFSGLSAQTYTVLATDANNCTKTTTLTITQPTQLIWTSTNQTNISCNGGNNGSISTTASGGTGIITYTLQPGSTSNTTGNFSNLIAQTYTVIATDVNGCSISTSLIITQPTQLVWTSTNQTNVSCNGGNNGTLSTIATGGTGSINYTLQPGSTSNTTGSFLNLVSQNYTVIATDANGCSISTSVNITQPSLLNITSITNTIPSCVPGNDASLTITANGGTPSYQYSIGGANQTSNVFTNLGSGIYTITVTDANGCTKTSIQSIITPNAPIINSALSTNINCNGGNNGTITTTATGGTGIITYTLQPGGATNTTGSFSNLIAQNYTVVATDNIGCSNSTIVTITQPSQLIWSSTNQTNISCNGGNNGSITTTATGGTGIITYTLQPGSTSNTTGNFSNLIAQTYTVTATDLNGCSISTSLIITQPTQLVWTSTNQTNVSCNGGNNGTLSTIATGGTGIINYTLQPGSTSNTTGSFSNLVSQNYTVIATDANGCSISTSINITQPSLLNIVSITNTIPSCVPGNDASLTITANGGTPSYQYSIGGANQTSNVFTNLGSGIYTITVTDANGCTKTSIQSIITPNAPIINSALSTNINCNGGNNGTITTTATGGTGIITYTLQPGGATNTTGNFSNLIAQNYTVIATDNIGCSNSTIVTITQPTQLIWTSTNQTNISCNGGNNGTITTTAIGGTGIITYALQPGSTSNTTGNFSNLIAQTYTVTATDMNGCSISTSLIITQPTQLIWTSTNQTNVSCNGGNNGTLSTTATGGTGIITYTLQPGSTSNTTGSFSNLVSQNYTVIATDANGCSISTSINITQPSLLNITSITNTIPSCVPGNDASLTITANGGTPSYQYSIGGANQTNNVFTNLGSGIYTITVTDANGCTKTSIQSIITPNAPIINSALSTNINCNGGNNGTITTTATGGTGIITYSLQPGGATNTTGSFSNLIAQNYTVIATDNIGCSNSTIVTITQPTQLIWSSTNQTNISCNGGNNGTLSTTATGGTGIITYTLQPGSASNTTGIFSNLIAQTYTVIATDVNGCSISTNLIITQPTQLIWTSTNQTNVSCNGGNNGTLSTIATGGTGIITYTLQPGSSSNTTGSFSNLVSQNYTVIATDANGCSISTSINITQPSLLNIISITNTIPSCVPGNDASLTITANGGTPSYQYSIGGANQTSNVFTNLGSGIYTVTVTDANGCTKTSIQSIITPNAPIINSALSTNVNCNGGNNGTITTTATGGTGIITYTLQPGGATNTTGSFSNLIAQNYTVIATDNIGCSNSTIVTITQPLQLIWSSTNQTNISCNGGNNGSITSTAIGGTGIITYTLQPGSTNNTTGNFSNLIAQTYTVIATDMNGCSLSTSLIITQPTQLIWTSTNQTNVSCNGGNNGTLSTIATGGTGITNYTLQPGSTSNTTGSFSNLVSQNYTVIATDANGCSISTNINITQPSLLNIASITNSIPSCVPGNDASLTITANGGTPSYQYSIGGANQTSNVFTNLGSGIYTITVTDANGCTKTSIQSIITPNAPIINSALSTNINCNGGNNGTITTTATGGTGIITYTLQPGGATNTTGSFSNLIAQNYTVIATDNIGCSNSTIVTITQPTQLIWSSSIQTNISCNGGNNGTITNTATGGTGIITYTLQPGSTSNTTGNFSNLIAQTYTVIATDINGCSISTSLIITQPSQLIWTSTNQTNISCNGGNNGTITTTASGGTGIINYTLQPGSTSNTTGSFSNLVSQNYSVIATDANGCSISTSINITQPPLLNITSITNTIPSCVPGNDASLTITANGGTPSYQYSIGGANQTNNVFTNLGSGIYTITVTDANGCTKTSIQSIITPNSPIITNIINTNASCIPGNDATITISSTGGTGAYVYSINLSPSQIANVFNGLAAGVYTATVTDAIGCSASSTTIVSTQPSPMISGVVTTFASCNPGCDANATISASGGSGVYTYSLDGILFQSGTVFSGLCSNQYTVTVKDGNGCTSNSVFTISTANAPLFDSISSTNILCFGDNTGQISVIAIGGTGAINYTIQPLGLLNTSGIFTNLFANTYTIIASDINGCTVNTSLQITQPPLLQFDTILSNGTLCSGSSNGSLNAPTLGGTGLISYSINPIATFSAPYTFTNLVGNTTYTILAVDANNCSITTTVYIPQANAINIVNLSTTNNSCNAANDGIINISAIGGTGLLTYSIQPGGASNITGNFNALSANLYTVTITDANNCTITTLVTITQPPAIILDSISINNISCNNLVDGSISISCSGGIGPIQYTLQPSGISNSTGIFNGLNAQIYTLIATDSTGCVFSTNATIINPLPLNFTSVSQTNALCFGDSNGTISLAMNGGTGLYTFAINPLPTSNNTGLFNSLPTNTYTINVTDANNCSVSTTVNITQPSLVSGIVVSAQNVTCFGDSNGACSVLASGGYSPYQYSLIPTTLTNGLGVFNNIVAGIYTVGITDSNGCNASVGPIIISQPPQLVWNSVTHQDIICYGDNIGSIEVNVIGGSGIISYSIQPSFGVQTSVGIFTSLPAYSYTVIATDAIGCSTSTIVGVNQNPALVFTNIDFKRPICFGNQDGSISATGFGGIPPLSFQLNNGTPTSVANFANLSSGYYTLTLNDAVGCKKDTLIFLSQPDLVMASDIDITQLGCEEISNGKIVVIGQGGTGGLTYYLSPGLNINKTGVFQNLSFGSYNLTIKDSSGCQFDTTLTISLPLEPLAVTITKQDLSCAGAGIEGWAQANVTGGTMPYNYTWNTTPPQNTDRIENLTYGYYVVNIVDANGCKVSDQVYIKPGNCCDQVFIPNAFTPNGDGVNDVFKVTTTAGIDLLQFGVYDRWGNKVWSSIDYKASWDGTYQGKTENMDTFYYIFWYICLTDGQKYMRKGDLLLLR